MAYHESDNVMVQQGKDYRNFFMVYFGEVDERHRILVSVSRYGVPGRCDAYDFGYMPSPEVGIGDRIAYFTDVGATMSGALRMVRNDLNKDQVVQLIQRFCEPRERRPYARTLRMLLGSIAPTSKGYIALERMFPDIGRRSAVRKTDRLQEPTTETQVDNTRLDRSCPRCRCHVYHWARKTLTAGKTRVVVTCTDCGHTWKTAFLKAEWT